MDKYDFLKKLTESGGFIPGQSIGDAPDYDTYINGLAVPVCRVNLYTFNNTEEQARQAIDYAIYHHKRGGLVVVDFQPHNLWDGLNFRSLTGRDLIAAVTPGSLANATLNAELDRVAVHFRELQAAGIAWAFRPGWEWNHTDYTWCGLSDAVYWSKDRELDIAQVVGLWRYIHDYFIPEFEDNIVWSYSVSVDPGEWIPLDVIYPGDTYIDVVGLTMYQDEPFIPGPTEYVDAPGYETLLKLDKPLFLWEWGPYPSRDGSWDVLRAFNTLQEYYPAFVGALFWHNWTKDSEPVLVALKDQTNADAFLADPRVTGLEALYPKFTRISTRRGVVEIETRDFRTALTAQEVAVIDTAEDVKDALESDSGPLPNVFLYRYPDGHCAVATGKPPLEWETFEVIEARTG